MLVFNIILLMIFLENVFLLILIIIIVSRGTIPASTKQS